ncbi:MAG: hypothetical protein ACFB14_27870 [Leptolyngbyaceae cyanobacterium]
MAKSNGFSLAIRYFFCQKSPYLFGDTARATLGPQNGIFALVVLVIGGFNWMSVARLVRAGFLATRDRTYMQAVEA